MIIIKSPATNGRFGASGGVGSSESEQVTSLFALVRAFVKLIHKCRQTRQIWTKTGQKA